MNEFTCIIWKVEHGSAAFVQCPNGRTIMFDAGSSDDFSPSRHLKRECRLGRLDWLIISHPDRDHISDLPHLHSKLRPRRFTRNQTIPARLIYPSGTQSLKEPLLTYRAMTEEYRHPVAEHLRNPPAANWGGVLVERFTVDPSCLKECPDDHLKNNLSLVSVVKYNEYEIVFPGDIEPQGWDALLLHTHITDSVGKGDIRILVAPHHGRKSGIRTSEGKVYDNFLSLMQPHLVLISDRWGTESTDPDAYRPHCIGHQLYSLQDKKFYPADVVTTKTNNFVMLVHSKGSPVVCVP